MENWANAAESPTSSRMPSWAAVMGTKSASIIGPVTTQENREKQNTMKGPGTPRVPSRCTMV